MVRVEFEADTLEELVGMARRWVAAYPELAASEAQGDERTVGSESLEQVLGRIRSRASRQFLREIGERTLVGDALVIDDALRERCGLAPGQALVGVLGVANRTMRKRAGRDLISWDPAAGGYRVATADAQVILEAFGPPTLGTDDAD